MNVLCNATFIFGLFGLPKLGVTGVALGTVIARISEVLICLIYSLRSSDVRFRIKYFFAKSDILLQDFIKIATPAVIKDVYKRQITNRDRMFDCPQNLREEEMFEVPDWAANKVVYQIFPARFAASKQVDKEQWYKAPISSMDDLHGDLRGIIEHLDHVQNLKEPSYI